MRTSKLAARLLSVVLAVMMVLSLVTVGFTASAADVEKAETGATIPAGTVLYLKPNSNWTQSSAWFAAYLWDSANTWVKMEKVADTSATVYKMTVPAGTWKNIIFCRMNPSATALSWDSKWDQSQDLTWSGSSVNCWAPASGQWNNASGSWSFYNDPTLVVDAPAAPAAPTVTVNGTLGGTGTEADPYLVAPEAATNVIVSGTIAADAKGLAYGINTTTKTDLAEGGISALASVTAPAADETAAVAVNLWAYAGTGANKVYSETYATTTVYLMGYEATVDSSTPVEDNTYTLPYQKADGLYAYAGTEVAGTNAWQRWDEVNGTRYFYLPASASDTEVVILNTYAADVLVNGVVIPAGEYATVPYTDGTAIICGGATTQTLKVMKSDAEGALYINSADGMTTKNDAGVKTEEDATFDLYAFMTSGTKNQETGKLAGAVADATGVDEEETTVKKLKGRGNSTWQLAKKPFNITYDENITVDGMKGKKWSLLANAQDSSLLRNRLVYDLANEVNMHYACDSRFVDWFVNGDYKGSYQLTQKIEMGKNTVMPDLTEPEVEDVIDEETGDTIAYPKENFDFILELDTATNAANAGDLTFTTTRGQVMTHKTPDEPAEEQVAFMRLKYQAVEDALYGNDLATLATLVDINDFARAYLVNEVAKNLDSGVTSCYFVYDSDNEIFYMSPVWDYDNALGNSVSIAERHDDAGKALDLTRPDGWYAKELMHFDADFTGGRSVFSQACYMTSTVDGKTFMDIVKDVWAADFADTAAVLAGEAEAANGRLQSAEGYLASLAKSGAWNYSYGGWQLSNNTNNTWISPHKTLVMYDYDAEANTFTTSTKSYDETTLEGQANYAADWMLSRINWISAQFGEAEQVIPEGYITVYFENNWGWPDAKVHFWGGTTGAGTEWPGITMTYVDTTADGYDRYSVIMPADVEGIVFNGTGGYGADQSADITTGIVDGICYYMTYDSATNTKPCGSYMYAPIEGGDTTEPATGETTTTPDTTDATTATTGTPVDPEYITVYFSNAWMWTDVTVYFWGSAFEATPAWPGNPMTFVETNDMGQDIYKATIPADATGMLFAGKDNGAETQSPDITEIADGRGYYMDWNETDGTFVGSYEYVAPVDPTTTAAASSEATQPATDDATEPATGDATEPATGDTTTNTTIYLKINNDWPAADAWFAAYYWNADGDYGWATLTATETEGIYTAEVPADTTGLIFTRRNPASTELGWNSDTDTTKKIWNQTADINMTTDLTKNMFVLDAGWSDISGTWTEYDVNATTPTLPNVAEDTVVYFTNSNNWANVNVYTWGGAGASKAWPGDAMQLVGTNAFGQDIYTVVIPAGTEGFLFNGMTKGDEGNAFQTVDVALDTVEANIGYYPSEQVKTEGDADFDKWLLGTFTYTEGDATLDEATSDEVYLVGSFNDWKGIEMTADETGKIFTVSDVTIEAGTYEFIVNAFGKWLGNTGTIENVTEGEGWTFKDGAGNCKIKTVGGVYTFTFNAETGKVTATADISYTVTFNTGDFTVTAPDVAKHGEDYTFTIEAAEGFKVSAVIVDMKLLEAVDGAYTIANVKNNVNVLVITSEVVSEPAVMEFTVTFTDKDGNELKVETVKYGEAATAPEAPAVDGYEFKAWDTDFDYVTKDITVKATYKKIATPVAPSTTGIVKIDIAGGTGFTISVDGGAARPQGVSYMNTMAPKGATITVTANASSDATFVGWVNPMSGVILTSDLSYTFVASGNDFFKAMYIVAVDGVQMVTFKNDKAGNFGRVLDAQYYAAADAIQFPEAPTQVGFDFAGWNMTEADIQAAIAAGQDVTVLATWTKAIVPVQVTVNGGSGTGTYPANNQVTVKANAAESGQKFAYWVDGDGNVKSYNAEYSFFPSGDVELTAVFVAEDAEIEYQILVSLDSIDYEAQAAANKAVFTYSWYCPEGYTFVKAGLVAVNKDNFNEATLVAGTTDSNVYDRSPNATNNIPVNTYTWSKSNVFSGQTWVARAYVQYRDAEGQIQTVYSDIIEATKE